MVGVIQRSDSDGLVSERARLRMVEQLAHQGIDSELVLGAMKKVPRHLFVEQGLASRAYEDVALPIGHGQTISRPSTVARMLWLLAESVRPQEVRKLRALEIGTGCLRTWCRWSGYTGCMSWPRSTCARSGCPICA